jgi:hypothetical protein
VRTHVKRVRPAGVSVAAPRSENGNTAPSTMDWRSVVLCCQCVTAGPRSRPDQDAEEQEPMQVCLRFRSRLRASRNASRNMADGELAHMLGALALTQVVGNSAKVALPSFKKRLPRVRREGRPVNGENQAKKRPNSGSGFAHECNRAVNLEVGA